MGTLEITTAARPVDFEASLSVVCEKGLAQLGGIAVNELQIYSPESEACAECSEDFSGNVYGNGHSKMYQDISNYFRYDIDYPISMDDTLGTIKLLNAFYLSNESQNWSVVEDIGDSQRLGEIDNTLADLYRSRR
jgi:UDP-N-acetyl-2-amino-2-deoxyglucuronate dehydrogenase